MVFPQTYITPQINQPTIIYGMATITTSCTSVGVAWIAVFVLWMILDLMSWLVLWKRCWRLERDKRVWTFWSPSVITLASWLFCLLIAVRVVANISAVDAQKHLFRAITLVGLNRLSLLVTASTLLAFAVRARDRYTTYWCMGVLTLQVLLAIVTAVGFMNRHKIRTILEIHNFLHACALLPAYNNVLQARMDDNGRVIVTVDDSSMPEPPTEASMKPWWAIVTERQIGANLSPHTIELKCRHLPVTLLDSQNAFSSWKPSQVSLLDCKVVTEATHTAVKHVLRPWVRKARFTITVTPSTLLLIQASLEAFRGAALNNSILFEFHDTSALFADPASLQSTLTTINHRNEGNTSTGDFLFRLPSRQPLERRVPTRGGRVHGHRRQTMFVPHLSPNPSQNRRSDNARTEGPIEQNDDVDAGVRTVRDGPIGYTFEISIFSRNSKKRH